MLIKRRTQCEYIVNGRNPRKLEAVQSIERNNYYIRSKLYLI